MKILVYSATGYTEETINKANTQGYTLDYCEASLTVQTVSLAKGYQGVCCFVDDDVSATVLRQLASYGVGLVLLRCTGFNNVDLDAAEENDICVMRVSSYSPYAVAEFALAMMLTLNRKLHRAYNRVREGNFLLDGLLGFDVHGKTVGIIGTGKIGSALAEILSGFSCRILAYDLVEDTHCMELGVDYVGLDELLQAADIVSIHLPLTPQTMHLIDRDTLALMKDNAILINTSRGAIVDTSDLIAALKQRRLRGVGLDVYEEESEIYYHDLRDQIIDDDTFARLLTFPNVLVTGHQGFFTEEALEDIASTTIANIGAFQSGRENANRLTKASTKQV